MVNFNPFAPVHDYPSMLNKIGLFSFLTSVVATYFLRKLNPAIEQVLSPLTFSIPVGSGISIPAGTFLPAFGVALLSRIIKLHDRLSDLFRIRHRFDISHILYPLAIVTEARLNSRQVRQIDGRRKELMRNTFYKYASSGPGRNVIDAHYITMALDQWTWYWVVLEASAISFACAMIFLVFQIWMAAFIALFVMLFGVGFIQVIRKQCAEYALQQVEEIAKDPQRRAEIGATFHAL